MLLATLWVYACGDGTTEPRPYFPEPTAVTISPASAELTALGSTVQLTAEVRDQRGQVMAGATVAWASDATAATVSASGLVTAVGNGTVTVTATADEASGDAHVTVAIDFDRAALVALYNATDGPNWADNTNWLTDAPLGEWYGVRTDGQGRVVEIDLSGGFDYELWRPILHGLSGGIPPELGTLTNLEKLNLGFNALAGEVPPELGNLANLQRLNLGRNDLSGEVPPELGNLANLEALNLGFNALAGEVPPELGNLADLEALNLHQNGLSGEIPPELGNLSNLWTLGLGNNLLSGEIPPELGNLVNLRRLQLQGNLLSGPISPRLGNLVNLWELWLQGNDVCVPGSSAFLAWFNRIENRWPRPGVFCNGADLAALESLYDLTDGANWTESDGWLDGSALEEWHGVETDSLGRVTALALSDNGLSGLLPGVIGNLGQLASLRIDGNELGGRLPLSLTALDLEEFHYDGTDLCEPATDEFRRWSDGIRSHRGTAVQCPPLTERDALVALYEGTGGPGWAKRNGWLSDAPLRRWAGVEVDAQGRVVGLDLSGNGLSGPIPPELGGLSNLEELSLAWNALSGAVPPELGSLSRLSSLSLRRNRLAGPIPVELGGLSNLSQLDLAWNDLSGAIPPELGGLSNLWSLSLEGNGLAGGIPPELGGLSNLRFLFLHGNGLAGAIPLELGSLSNLWSLFLGENELTGPIPPDLGNLGNLRRMRLANNSLSGTIPPTFGGLASLTDLVLSHNPALVGPMPVGLRNLALESLFASGTELCVPREPEFEEWLATIPKRWIAACQPPAAYLVQTVQSLEHPVPLVAGEEAVLRVFVTTAIGTTEGIPKVRARFYLNGTERHVAEVPGSSAPIPTEIDEGDLAKSANVEIPRRIVRPGLEMVVEVDPDGVLDASLGVPKRIPAVGRLAVDVREIPVLDLTVIPVLWSSDPDSAIIALVEGMAADPEGHVLLEDTHVLLPVADIDVTAHEPVVSTSDNGYDLLREIVAIRVLEGGGGHYMGMMPEGGGLASRRSSISGPYPGTIAHELGHNMSLAHAPCGGAVGPDPLFPDPHGRIGAWGYDIRRGRLVPPTRRDHMSYCHPTWTSDYHFTKALRYRLVDEGVAAEAHATASVESLLLWGGVDSTDAPFLNPAFVVDAPPALPDSAGDYTVTGRDAIGREIFSLSFSMPETTDGDGSSGFAFALPVRPGWGGSLATITLSGPGGGVTLDGESDIPMAILRNPRTGQVRGFLRDMADPEAVQAAAAGTPDLTADGLDMLFSRGIPSPAAWRR